LPVLGVLALFLMWGRDPGPVLATVVAAVLAGAALTAVHHVEVVAHG
jgi:Ca2+:H+ antiporter